MLILEHMKTRGFWTTFGFQRAVSYNGGGQSKSTKILLTGFYRALSFSYVRPWQRSEYR